MSLSPRQYEILALRATGLTNLEVAHRIGRSYQTVKNNVADAYKRLGVMCDEQAYIALGWLTPPTTSARPAGGSVPFSPSGARTPEVAR